MQRYVQNLLLNLDTTKYKVDLFVGLCPADQASTAPALIAHGVNIIGVPDHKKDRIRALYRHLKNHKNYDIIHYHTASKIGAPAVSYTHLDVYKRQPHAPGQRPRGRGYPRYPRNRRLI